ncbi:MAG: DNA polymerase III subunit alpha [Spirochaetaceae bacterium]|jgi:DNA polymerase-3 subunit alpha|nr:DNA polymerase III subunit alpha [Spirochaetaceae bacterium]
MIDFTHLHVHTDASLLDGAATAADLAGRAAALGMKHLAITDHGNMFGVLKFRDACEKAGIHPIIGCEFYMTRGSRHDRGSPKHTVEDDEKSEGKSYHLVLLSTGETGYSNLLKLSSLAYTEGFYYKPRIDEELLVKYHEGLICLSACLAGEIPRLILAGKKDEAEKRALWFRDLFGADNYYLEIQDHGLKAQKDSNPAIIEIAKKTGIGLVVTNDVHYLEKADSMVHDVLLCIGTKKKRSDENRLRFEGDSFYLKTAEEMAALFPDYPEAVSNTIKIAERCKTEIPRVKTKELVNYLPAFDIPLGYENADDYMRALAMEGLAERYPNYNSAIKERAELELKTIIDMGFTGYFLIVADFINWAQKNGISVGPGRGSGPGSIVAYSLRITDIDPLKYNLLFERFLNPERISMPDFDVDFCQERRGEVIDYVTQKYGAERVGQIITFTTLKARAVIKDVARVLDIPLNEANMIAGLIPEKPQTTLESAFKDEPRLRELEDDPRYQELFHFARKLEGKARNTGLHAAGVVIGKSKLDNYVPLYRDSVTGGIATQFTMDQLESAGLVKMDFLGLENLDLIKNTVAIVRGKGPEYADFDIENIPENDKATFEMLGEGKSSGIFQFESEGMQSILKRTKPGKIEDLIALNALYRPGPMENIDQYINCKNGVEPIKYPDESLQDILEETYGVIVYQEQVMQVAQRIAGYSLGQADILRRAMGKKKEKVMAAEKEKFIAGAVEKGFTAKLAGTIFDILLPFAGYGFNKSHAAAYSVIAYKTAYLKANFPVEFMAAKLTTEINSTDRLPLYIDEARRMGIEVEPPDVRNSGRLFTVNNGKIFYGLLGIKGVGSGPAEEIVRAREDGPYKDFMDFLDRVDIKLVGKKVVELLIQTGAFDSFGIGRSTLAANLERAAEYAQKKKDDKNSAQGSLFEDSGEKEYADFEFIPAPEWERNEILRMEKELIGFYFSGHPLDAHKEKWQSLVTADLSEPDKILAGRDHVFAGVIKTLRSIQIKKGRHKDRFMGSGVLSDYNGDIEITFFADIWEKYRNTLAVNDIVVIKGKFDRRNENPAVIVKEVFDINDVNLSAKSAESESAPSDFSSTAPAISQSPASYSVPSLSLLDPYKDFWKRAVKINLANPDGTANEGEAFTLAGILTSLKPYQITKGKNKDRWMGFGSLSDYNGSIDITFFCDEWEKFSEKLAVDTVIAFKGTYNRRDDKQGLIFKELLDISRADEMAWRELHIRLQKNTVKSVEDLYPVRDCIYEYSGPCSVYFHVPVENNEVRLRSIALGAAPKTDHLNALKHCAVVADAWLS